MPFPDDRGVARGGEAFARVLERRVPAPGIGTNHAHAALEQIQRGFATDANPGIQIPWLAKQRPGAGVDQDNVQRLEDVFDARQLSLHFGGADHMAIRQMTKVQLHARLQAPVQRQFVDAESRLATVRGRGVVPRGVHMRTAVRRDLQALGRPGLVAGQLRLGQAGKHRGHLRPALLMVHVVDFRQQRRWIGVRVVVQGNGQVHQAAFS
ncbi:hypothetical protein D3C84_605290 [compost metagenome]